MPAVFEDSVKTKAEFKGIRRRLKAWFRRHARLRLVSIAAGEFVRAGNYLIVQVRERRLRHLRACLGEAGISAKWTRFRAGPRCTSFLFGYSRPDQRYVVQMVGRAESTQLFRKEQTDEALEALCRLMDADSQ